MTRKHKFGAVKTTIDGITFPSKKQANRYSELKLLEKAGAITDLKTDETHRKALTFILQEKFRDPRTFKMIRAITYIADFSYDENGVKVVEDVKGMKTKVFNIKWKMVKYHYPGIEFRIT